MVDKNFNKVEEGDLARVRYGGHHLVVSIFYVSDNEVRFRTINHIDGQPEAGSLNELEVRRYLTVID